MQERTDAAFNQAVAPLRAGLRLHCYRMLGSAHDADDVVQEALLRAWRAKESLSDPAMLRPWVYRIATNVCLDELKRRPRRALASDAHAPAADPRAPFAPPLDEAVWLEPMPDAWLGGGAGDGPDATSPAARYTVKESVALAFVAALQALSPSQRATLLLRDVLGFSAEETAEALGIGVGAANSALHRARTAVEEKIVGPPRTTDVDEEALARYVRAWDTSDIDAFVALLRDDVQTTMPPTPTWLLGRAANEAFFRQMFEKRGQHGGEAPVLVRIGANGQPAFAVYRPDAPGEPSTLHAIQVLEIRGSLVARIDHFMTSGVFPMFGLPVTASRRA